MSENDNGTLQGFKIFKDRHGKDRCYHRKTHTAVDLRKALIGSAVVLCRMCAHCCTRKGHRAQGGHARIVGRDIFALSDDFADKAERTKSDYQRVFDYLKPIADTPLSKFNPPLIARIRDRAGQAHGRRFGNYVKQIFFSTFQLGRRTWRSCFKILPSASKTRSVVGKMRPKQTGLGATPSGMRWRDRPARSYEGPDRADDALRAGSGGCTATMACCRGQWCYRYAAGKTSSSRYG